MNLLDLIKKSAAAVERLAQTSDVVSEVAQVAHHAVENIGNQDQRITALEAKVARLESLLVQPPAVNSPLAGGLVGN